MPLLCLTRCLYDYTVRHNLIHIKKLENLHICSTPHCIYVLRVPPEFIDFGGIGELVEIDITYCDN
jgi:hypothetical protein